MKKIFRILALGIIFLWIGVQCAWSSSYRFSFTGSDLTSFYRYSGDVTTLDPYPIGTRKMTLFSYDSATGSYDVKGEYYSDLDDRREYNRELHRRGAKAWYITGFNIWGIGGDAAERWGEDELYTATSPTSSNGWSSFFFSDGTLGWNMDTPTDWNDYDDQSKWLFIKNHAIKLNGGGAGFNFSFVADVTDPDLTIWFGGTAINKLTLTQDKHKYIKYQGNTQLTGTPVPIPGTLALLGAGLVSMGVLTSFRRRKRNRT